MGKELVFHSTVVGSSAVLCGGSEGQKEVEKYIQVRLTRAATRVRVRSSPPACDY
jgi:hypothetical protein